ncbi:hypothetical protein V8C42DRAFT_310387 [Trichoderma barbatum]
MRVSVCYKILCLGNMSMLLAGLCTGKWPEDANLRMESCISSMRSVTLQGKTQASQSASIGLFLPTSGVARVFTS